MKHKPQSMLLILLLFSSSGAQAFAQDSVLGAIPSDALAFAVVHNLTAASQGVDNVAQLVQAPAPNALGMAKAMTGLQQGLDEQGDAALILIGSVAEPKHVFLAPVANFADFFAALNAQEPQTGAVVEVQLAGTPMVAGRKGDYVALAAAGNRATLEAYLAGTNNLAADASLAEWLDANTVSGVMTARGVKEMLPKMTEGIRSVQQQMGAIPGANGASGADALGMYVDLFTAAETEVEQFGLGLRIDPDKTVALVKRVHFAPGGKWAALAANAPPADEDALAGLQAGPFLMALGMVVPEGIMNGLTGISAKVMQSQPGFQLSPEQMQRYTQLSNESLRGVRAMRMVLGVSDPGTGLYGNSSMVMLVENSQEYVANYEKAIVAMSELASEAQSPFLPISTSQRVALGESEALEVTMDMSNIGKLTTPGGPDMKNVMQMMWGTSGNMKIYVAPADEHAVVMNFASLEKLREAIDFYKSQQPGLSSDAGVAKVAAALPTGSQLVMYVSFNGMAQMVRQILAATPGMPVVPIPELPDNPPLGIAAKVTPQGVDGRMVISADSLRAIGEVVAKAHGAVPGPGAPQE